MVLNGVGQIRRSPFLLIECVGCLNGLKFDGFWKKRVGLMVLNREIRGKMVLNSKNGDHLDNPHCRMILFGTPTINKNSLRTGSCTYDRWLVKTRRRRNQGVFIIKNVQYQKNSRTQIYRWYDSNQLFLSSFFFSCHSVNFIWPIKHV